MNAARVLVEARRRTGLSQRELARRAGVSQSTIARIESGVMDPGLSTFDALLRGCGDQLATIPRAGVGVDRSLIRSCLSMSPRERLETAARAGDFFARIRRSGGPSERLRGRARSET